ncbi:MAG: twin-arginine translocation signal domain-containing protein [Alphaproteobacteria bacterium]|nr:twin-arginine translocation signal domain-containing protein [Alphaproteobacteria bacterium]
MTGIASRRRFLAAAAGGGTAILLGWPRDARAFSVQPMDAPTAEAFANACGAAAAEDHRLRALAFLRENAAGPVGQRLSPEAADALLARTTCPVCGCIIGPLEAPPGSL